MTHSLSAAGTSQIPLPGVWRVAATPALLQRMCTLPNSATARSARCCTELLQHRVGRHADHPRLPLLEFGNGLFQRILLDVRHDHLHAGRSEPFGEGEADAAGGTGDDGSFSFECLDDGLPWILDTGSSRHERRPTTPAQRSPTATPSAAIMPPRSVSLVTR